MHPRLACKLLERGVIRADTEFEAHFAAHGLSCQSDTRLLGRFRVVAAAVSGATQRVMIQAERAAFAPGQPGNGGAPVLFSSDDVVTLDGMPPARLAATYDLSPDGEHVEPAKRRGRKPRARSGPFAQPGRPAPAPTLE